MPKLTRVITVLAISVALGSIVFILLQEDGPREDATPDLSDVEMQRTERSGMTVEVAQGGVYGGIVVDESGKPIRGATVLLVAYNAGDMDLLNMTQGQAREFDPGDPSSVPTIGDYSIGGREAVTEVDGRWKIPAHSMARISHVIAYHQRYFVNAVRVDRPRNDVSITLKPAGRVKGSIVDHETGRPVSNVRVDVYLQHPTAPAPEVGESGAYARRAGVKVDRSELAMLGHFLAKELGQRIWGIPYQGTESLRFRANADGTFELGPLGEGVQLEFVMTHNDYRWYDFDTDDGAHPARRTIVEGGETVEREFRLRKGKVIEGVVLDDSGSPLEGVSLAFESITAYKSHWWDRAGFKRRTSTGRDGRFRMGGLALGKHNILLRHAAFGQQYEHGVRADTKDLEIRVPRKGRIVATVVGLQERPAGGRIYIFLEPTGTESANQTRIRRRWHVLDAKNRFGIEDVREGPYNLWIIAGNKATQPLPLEVKKGSPSEVTLEIGGGGSLELRLLDSGGRAVDPATVMLMKDTPEGLRGLGRFVSRAGLLATDHVVPGVYRLKVEAPGYMPVLTDPIQVADGEPTDAGEVKLIQWGHMRLQSVLTDRRKTPTERVTLSYRQGPDEKWTNLFNMAGHDTLVKPGLLTVRASTPAGMTFEQEYTVTEGQTVTIDVVLREP